ncbi:MAG: ragb/susd domain [Bacteroidetes bacterium]|nr:MAG: ragb/susd domain [Bacteroidota bacterium]
MRKILIFVLLLFASCETDLDLRPKMQISTEEAFSNRENVQAALTGCYDALQLQHYYGRNLVIVGDLASDNSIANGTKVEYYDVDKNSLLANNILVEGIWADIYVAINRVNFMLFKLRDVTFLTEDEMKSYKGELHFLRALHYYNLVRLYGGVPLKLLPTLNDSHENSLPRSSAEDVYNQILADLESARLNISNTLSERATVEAATALLASITLTRGNAENAIQYANQVLQSFPMLETSYEALFSSNTAPGREILFYVPFSATDKNRLAEYNFPNTLGGRHENAPSSVLINIDSSDKRKTLIAASHGDKYYTKKYADLTTGSDRVIVLRTAEMYLIRAEAHYLIDSVGNLAVILSDINTIRNRAGLSPVIADTITSLRNIIEREKQIEFAFEGKRWFDLIRTGRAVDLVPTVTQEWQMLFPIPLSELLTNNKISVEDQNEGY